MIPIHQSTTVNIKNNKIYYGNILDIIQKRKFDIVYLDPPYNYRQYSNNYSPLNYIAHYDPTLMIKGKTGVMTTVSRSSFCQKNNVKASFHRLIDNIKCNYLILSYNSEGLLSEKQLKTLLLTKGNVKLYKICLLKFRAHKNVKHKCVTEHIWFVDCNSKPTSKSDSTFEVIILDELIKLN